MTILAGKSNYYALKTVAIFFVAMMMVGFFTPLTMYRAEVRDFSGATMGTRYTVRIVDDSWAIGEPLEIAGIQKRIDQRLGEINRMMSTYDPESELSRFNQSTDSDWFSVSQETTKVVAFALEVAKKTDGSLDPTVGPLVNLWGFGPDKSRSVPTDDELAAALENVGYQQLEARNEPPALRKTNPKLYVDLSAIAKGFAVDDISDLLSQAGFDRTMVEIGGEVRTRGTRPDGSAWRIGVEKPDRHGSSLQTILELKGGALASSGDYRNFFMRAGIRYSHTIDPKTGSPVQHQLATVSVRTKTCLEADALATALLVMGEDRGYDWCVEHKVAALFLIRDEDKIIEKSTPKFLEQHPTAESPTRER